MIDKIFILLFVFFIIVSSSTCKTCLENPTYVWGTTWDNKIVPDTMSTCWGIITCNHAICEIRKIADVSHIMIQPSNDTRPNNQILSSWGPNKFLTKIKFQPPLKFSIETTPYSIEGTCTEGQTFVMGLDSKYRIVHNEVGTCWGMLSCNEMICNMYDVKEVAFISLMPINENSKI
jgi:hypothetical protein